MGKYASIQNSSTTRQAFRVCVLLLMVPAVTIGCRGPWFQKTDSLDALVVKEKGEPRTPRPFASSRLRPSSVASLGNSAPNPISQSQAISDEPDTESIGDELPSESQDLLRRQMEAIKQMQQEGAGDLLAQKEPSPNFKLSDDEESHSFGNVSSEKEPEDSKPVKTKPRPSAKSMGGKTKDHQKSPVKDLTSLRGILKPKDEQSSFGPEVKKNPVVNAEALEDVDASSEGKIRIETAKNDWRVLASETLAALQAESDGEVALSPDQKLAIEAKKRMLSLILDDVEGAMTPIENLQAHEQEFFQHEFQALHAATDPKGNPVLNRRWTLALQSHRKAQQSLAAVSNLEIHNATFCTEVDSFGILTKFPQYHFRQNQELLLYCELDNFVSTPVKDGYETQLQGSYEILDSNGRRVADQLLPPDEHICRNQRRDYFIAYRIYTPQDIKPGRYTLKLTIEDMKGHKFGQHNVEFQIIP
jgi:hypothetical protein